MEENREYLLKRIEECFSNIEYIKSVDIPNIDLYMDQVTTFMNTRLKSSSRNPEQDKFMTKTMINNYAKNDLLPSPEKKKYTKEHVVILLFIYYFKSFLSISDIQTLLQPITENFFGKDTDIKIADIYDEICRMEKSQIEDMRADALREYELAMKTFQDAPEDSRDFLQTFSLICALGFDLYMKQALIEKLIDDMREKTESE